MAYTIDPRPSLDKPAAQHNQSSSDEIPIQPAQELPDGYFKSRLFIGTVVSAGFGMIGVRTALPLLSESKDQTNQWSWETGNRILRITSFCAVHHQQ